MSHFFLPLRYRLTLSFSAQTFALHPYSILIFYLDYVTAEHLRPCLYYRDTTQHRHCRTSFTGGDDSESGCHLS